MKTTKGTWEVILTITLILLITIFLVDDNDIRIPSYIILGFIIVFITYTLWVQITMDDINNEEEKRNFLNEQFNHFVNSEVQCKLNKTLGLGTRKTIKYTINSIRIIRPRKRKKDTWWVRLEMENPSWNYSFIDQREMLSSNDTIVILNISDTELDKIMINKKGLKSLINPIKKTMGGLEILTPDFIKPVS
tara:strand:+ start:21 stop:593 length:573 start_codon:yes stop_codon:yes gene_type:complete